MRPGSSEAGLGVAAFLLLARLALVIVLLWAYREAAPAGLLFFGLALAFGFTVVYGIELVRFAGLHRYMRPARTRS